MSPHVNQKLLLNFCGNLQPFLPSHYLIEADFIFYIRSSELREKLPSTTKKTRHAKPLSYWCNGHRNLDASKEHLAQLTPVPLTCWSCLYFKGAGNMAKTRQDFPVCIFFFLAGCYDQWLIQILHNDLLTCSNSPEPIEIWHFLRNWANWANWKIGIFSECCDSKSRETVDSQWLN